MTRMAARRSLAAAVVAAAASVALASPATAKPSIYEPAITACGHLFRAPLDPPRPGAALVWSPWGTADIVCFDVGFAPIHYYQRDPAGQWHAMNELIPGSFFTSVFGYPRLPA